MKLFIDSGNLKEIEALVPLGIIDGITTNPSLLAKEGGDYRAHPEEDLRDRERADQRRSRRHRCRGHAARRARARQDRPAHRRQGAVHQGRRPGVQDAVVGGHPRQRDADLHGRTGAARGEGRRHVREPVRRPARRHRDLRHEPDQRDRRDLRELRLHHRGAGRLDPRPDAHRRSGAHGRRHLHLSRRRSSKRCSSTR